MVALAQKNELNMWGTVCNHWGNRSIIWSLVEGKFRCLTRFSNFSRKSTKVCDFLKLANWFLGVNFDFDPVPSCCLRKWISNISFQYFVVYLNQFGTEIHYCVWSEAEQNLGVRMHCLTCQSAQQRFPLKNIAPQWATWGRSRYSG